MGNSGATRTPANQKRFGIKKLTESVILIIVISSFEMLAREAFSCQPLEIGMDFVRPILGWHFLVVSYSLSCWRGFKARKSVFLVVDVPIKMTISYRFRLQKCDLCRIWAEGGGG